MRGLTVVIPSRTTENFIEAAEAVRRHEPTATIRVIDDGLDLSFLPRPDLMPCYGNTGIKPFVFARNCNLGMKAAREDDVILLNDDAILESPGGFTLMQRAAEENQKFGIIGAVTNVTGAAHQKRKHGLKKGLRSVPEIAFVCVLIPRRTINRVGYLDERYCIDYGVEDKDYCTAVFEAGLLVGVHDECFVDHGSLKSTFRGMPDKAKSFKENLRLYKEKCKKLEWKEI